MMDELTKTKAKSLLLKNFSVDEVAKVLQLEISEVETLSTVNASRTMQENSVEFYNDLQKELSRLALTEMNKPNRDSNVVLSAIKLQAEMQEKKLKLNKIHNPGRVSKDYIYERDEKMHALHSQGKSKEEIATLFGISNLSVVQALDRVDLNLPDNLKTLSPTLIAETSVAGLDKASRLKILQEAYDKNLTRKDVREMMIQLKDEMRKV